MISAITSRCPCTSRSGLFCSSLVLFPCSSSVYLLPSRCQGKPLVFLIVRSQILMHDLTEKRMDELKLNEWIMTPSKNLSSVQDNRVKSWLHRMPEVDAEFLM